MPVLRLSGLLTGINTAKLVAQIMAIERRTLNMYEARRSKWEEKRDALSTLETKLSTLRSSVSALSNADKLRAFATSSSDTDILTAKASYNAFEGNHTVVINQLANAERWVHTNGLEYAEDYVGEGTFIYSYNHQETILTTTATTTLEDLVGRINNDANNPGVTASLLYYNGAYHLVLNGNEAGTDYTISINASSTEVWEAVSALTDDGENATLATKITELDDFDGVLSGDEYIRISGKNHNGVNITYGENEYLDLTITENTKLTHLISEINDYFDGVAKAILENGKIILTDDTCGASGLVISLQYNDPNESSSLTLPTMAWETEGGSTAASLSGFDDETADWGGAPTQAAQDSQIRVDGYPPGAWISRSSNTIDDVIHGVTLHLHDTGTVQVNLTRDIESVKDKLNAMITAYNAITVYIQEKTGYNDVLKTAGVLMGDYIVSTIKNRLSEPLYTQTNGFIVDIDAFLTPGQIGLELGRDGLLNLDTNVFNEAIAEDYMGVLAIIGADKTGSSTSNTVEFYGASSRYTTAGTYDVQVKITSGAIEWAKIKLSTESTYRDATYSGNIVTGDSSFDDNGDPVYPENALQLSVDLSQDGTFTATVRVKQGFTGAMEDALDRMLKATTGSIQIAQEYTDDTLDELKDRIEDAQDRLDTKETRLIAKFAKLESTLALLQQQMAVLGFGMI